jgi:hypothetical protein
MKKLFIMLLILLLPTFVFGAGSDVTETRSRHGSDIREIKLAWTADDSDGSVPTETIEHISGWIFYAVTNPGATAPTDNYDITITTAADGQDIFGNELADRDTSNSEQVVPKIGNAYGAVYVDDTLTFTLTNNSVNDAVGVLKILYWEE